MKPHNIGLEVAALKKSCKNNKCPFHGFLKVRGRVLTGTVISAKMQKTATVEFTRRVRLPKYERYENRRSRLKAHNPECLKAEEGEVVRIAECRPLSKTVNFVIIEKKGREKDYIQRRELLDQGRAPKKPFVEKEDGSN